MQKVIILLNRIKEFNISVENGRTYTSMNVKKLVFLLRDAGFDVEAVRYEDLDFNKNYKNAYVIYHSAEDTGLKYQRYMHDILFWFNDIGCILIPSYKYALAHHNKNMMELLRKNFSDKRLKTVESSIHANYLDIKNAHFNFPVIIKLSEGSGSSGVFLANSQKEMIKILKKATKSYDRNLLLYFCKKNLYKLLGKNITSKEQSIYNTKYLIQNFIKGLTGDYKVLIFTSKYYVLKRDNRLGDFRASGSGLFSYPILDDVIKGLLDYSKLVYKEIGMPILSLDIGFDGNNYHLFEFQCVHIGPYTLQLASHYFSFTKDCQWYQKEGKSNLEEEYVRALLEYIQENQT